RPRSRLDFQMVHEPLGAGEAHSQTTSRGIALLHGQIDICNPRSAVDELQLNSAVILRLHIAPSHDALTRVFADVARQLGGGGYDPSDTRLAKAEPRGGLPQGTPGAHDVAFSLDRKLACEICAHLRGINRRTGRGSPAA